MELASLGRRGKPCGKEVEEVVAAGTVENRARNDLEVLEVAQDHRMEEILASETTICEGDLDTLEGVEFFDGMEFDFDMIRGAFYLPLFMVVE